MNGRVRKKRTLADEIYTGLLFAAGTICGAVLYFWLRYF